jgi:hypothetical protein
VEYFSFDFAYNPGNVATVAGDRRSVADVMKPYSLFGRAPLAGVVMALVFATCSDAQFTDDFQANIISVISNWTGDYFIGSNTVYD